MQRVKESLAKPLAEVMPEQLVEPAGAFGRDTDEPPPAEESAVMSLEDREQRAELLRLFRISRDLAARAIEDDTSMMDQVQVGVICGGGEDEMGGRL